MRKGRRSFKKAPKHHKGGKHVPRVFVSRGGYRL